MQNNRNKVHNKRNALESSQNHPPQLCSVKNCLQLASGRHKGWGLLFHRGAAAGTSDHHPEDRLQSRQETSLPGVPEGDLILSLRLPAIQTS